VFPDTDDFGRVFRNNAVMSAMGIPQITAIMGMCVAAALPSGDVRPHFDAEGSGLFLAGPALVQAAIGQKPPPKIWAARRCTRRSAAPSISASQMTMRASSEFARSSTKSALRTLRHSPLKSREPLYPGDNLRIFRAIRKTVRHAGIIARVVDASEFEDIARSMARRCFVDTRELAVGLLELSRIKKNTCRRWRAGRTRSAFEFGGVIYTESAEKAARFILDCNQNRIPLVFCTT